MLVFYDNSALGHQPQQFFRRGKIIAAPEGPARFRALHDAAAAGGHDLRKAVDHGAAPLSAVHDARYLDFLKNAWARRGELGASAADADEILTTQFARMQMHRGSAKLANQLGYFTSDTSTPIRHDTWAAAYGAAQCAITGADAALEQGAAYALCRPPGHHAFADCAGGFCFLNNTAIAAQRMRDRTGGRIAVLDVDVHHGNGTQGIFYERPDVLTVSIHADPSDYFPLYAGYADERGAGAGQGFNLNLPLAHGAGDKAVLAALASAIEHIRAFRPAALVVALGLDAAADDPLGVFDVSSEGFAAMGAAAAQLRLPSVLVQEGGYLSPSLGRNLNATLAAFEHARC
jgi:acetoin utilization deacetylase AcuC-like enzyme